MAACSASLFFLRRSTTSTLVISSSVATYTLYAEPSVRTAADCRPRQLRAQSRDESASCSLWG